MANVLSGVTEHGSVQLDVVKQAATFDEGLSVCESCLRLIPAKVILKGNFSYLVKECIFENRISETLLCKGMPENYKRIPRSWPQLSIKIGEKFEIEDNVLNFHRVPAVVFYITSRCNSECSICKKVEFLDMDIEFMKRKLLLYKNKEVILYGGEPTVRNDIIEIIKLVKQSGNIPALHTNGLKLSNKEYVQMLKKSGLEIVYLSFDGFDHKICSKIRGSEKEYNLKLQALKNLEDCNLYTILNMTLIKDLNESQVGEVLKYANKKSFIVEVMIRPLSLYGLEENFGFNKNNVFSKEEIINLICKTLNISSDEFALWDDNKIHIAFLLERLFPFFQTPVFQPGRAYFKKTSRGLTTLLSKRELADLSSELKDESVKGLWKLFLFLGRKLLPNITLPFDLNEKTMLHKLKLLKVSVVSSYWSISKNGSLYPLIIYDLQPRAN